MKYSLNHEWLHLTEFDSMTPTGGSTVVHQFDEEGEYRVRFIEDDTTVAETRLVVTSQERSGARKPASNVIFDLADVGGVKNLGGSTATVQYPTIHPKGHASFTDSSGSRRFAVIAESAAEKRAVLDSRQLQSGDIFALTMVRPGEYRIVNEIGGYEGRITVAYPIVGDRPYRPPSPQTIACKQEGFTPERVEMKPAQGLIITVDAPARIRITLTEPDDGPDQPSRPRASFSREKLLEALQRRRDSAKSGTPPAG